jgi:dsDNA-specific endonuclease/ATPase MutS2
MGFLEQVKRWMSGSRGGEGRTVFDDEDEEDVDPFNPFPEPVEIEIEDVFDLHTINPRDVKLAVEEYLREARRAGFRSVRIIHGKGRGVQRKTVRKILARTPFVEEWADAPPHDGGFGATVVHLLPQSSEGYEK